jgi:plasmid stabilization system protein ParE
LGKRFVESIRQVFESLEANPSQFSSLETLSPNVPIRRALVKDFPYVIVFEIFADGVFVYAVAHAARMPNYWRRRKRPED